MKVQCHHDDDNDDEDDYDDNDDDDDDDDDEFIPDSCPLHTIDESTHCASQNSYVS